MRVQSFCVGMVLVFCAFFYEQSYAQTLDATHLGMYNPLNNGASCTSSTLSAAIAASGSANKTIYLTNTDRAKAPCTWLVTSDVVVPTTRELYIPFGARFVGGGGSITFNNCPKAGKYQIFDGVADVTLQCDAVYPEWFGGDATDAISDTAAIQQALNAGSVVELSVGTWTVDAPVSLDAYATLQGVGRGESDTIINCTVVGGVCLRTAVTDTAKERLTIQNFKLIVAGEGTTGILLHKSRRSTLRNLAIRPGANRVIGLHGWSNKAVGETTNNGFFWTTVDNIVFDTRGIAAGEGPQETFVGIVLTGGQHITVGTIAGTFQAGETIRGNWNYGKAYVEAWNSPVIDISHGEVRGLGDFVVGEPIVGLTSGATAVISSFDANGLPNTNTFSNLICTGMATCYRDWTGGTENRIMTSAFETMHGPNIVTNGVATAVLLPSMETQEAQYYALGTVTGAFAYFEQLIGSAHPGEPSYVHWAFNGTGTAVALITQGNVNFDIGEVLTGQTSGAVGTVTARRLSPNFGMFASANAVNAQILFPLNDIRAAGPVLSNSPAAEILWRDGLRITEFSQHLNDNDARRELVTLGDRTFPSNTPTPIQYATTITLGASQTNQLISATEGSASIDRLPQPWAGSIVGLSIRMGANPSGSGASLTFKTGVNASPVANGPTAVLTDTSSPVHVTGTANRFAAVFSAGDALNCMYDSNSSTGVSSPYIACTIYVVYHNFR